MNHPYPGTLHYIKHLAQVYLWGIEKGRRYYTAHAADAEEEELLLKCGRLKRTSGYATF